MIQVEAKIFFRLDSKAQSIKGKIGTLGFIKSKNLCCAKDQVNRIKDKLWAGTQGWERVFANHISNIYLEYMKNFQTFTLQKSPIIK